MSNQKGLMIIEVLVTLGIAAIIFALGVFSYREWLVKVKLVNDRDELKSALLRSQQLATAAAGGTAWGLHLEASHYVLFPGNYYDENNPNNQTWSLNGSQILNASSTFADGAGGYIADTVFAKFTGETHNTGTIMLAVPFNTSTVRTVQVAESGQIY